MNILSGQYLFAIIGCDSLKRIISNIADSYGLYDLHKKFSKEDLFRYVKEEVAALNADFAEFYTKPALPVVSYENVITEKACEKGQLKFPSRVENGSSNKDAIFHYSKGAGTENNINVIFIHGWRAEELNRLEKVFFESFVERGYNIYSYVLPFHMERAPEESLYSGEYFISADVSRTLKTVQQAVSDIRALISLVKAEKDGKIIVIGLSLGGVISNLLAEVEENIDVLISLFYANKLSFTVFKSEAGKYIKKDFEKNDFSYELLKESWKIINPSPRKPVLDLDKILLVSGKYDKYVLKEDTDTLWENWGKPKRYVYDCGHSGIVLSKGKIRKAVLEFIDKRV